MAKLNWHPTNDKTFTTADTGIRMVVYKKRATSKVWHADVDHHVLHASGKPVEFACPEEAMVAAETELTSVVAARIADYQQLLTKLG